MNITEGKTLWNEEIGILKNYPYLSKNRKCDVLVVGGGIGGALTAYMQAKAGVNVIVVDKNIVGYGATMENNGVLESRLDILNDKYKNISEKNIYKCNALCKKALDDILQIILELENDEECKKYIDKLQVKNTDLMYFSEKITGKITMYKAFEKLGRENDSIEYLEQDPLINLKTGIVFPNAACLLNPYVLTQLIFMHIAKLKNVEIYENTNIVDITSKEDVVESISQNKFKIYSKNVIFTSGVHSLKYLNMDDISVNKTFTLATEKLEGLDKNILNIVAKEVNFPNITVAVTKSNQILLTGEDIKQNEKMINPRYFNQFANGRFKKLYYTFRKLLNLEDVKIQNCFYGVYLETKDGLPIIDELENIPNVYCNLGVGKNGIIFSMIGATMLKDISKQCHVKDMYLFRENR